MDKREQPMHKMFFGSFIRDSNTKCDFRFEGMAGNNERRPEEQPTRMAELVVDPMPQHNNPPSQPEHNKEPNRGQPPANEKVKAKNNAP